jgi:hypothetical protein
MIPRLCHVLGVFVDRYSTLLSIFLHPHVHPNPLLNKQTTSRSSPCFLFNDFDLITTLRVRVEDTLGASP